MAITDGPAVKGPVHTRLPCGQRSPGSAPSETADQPLSPGVLTSKGFSFGLPGLPSVSKELMIRKCCYSQNPGKTAPAVRPRLGSLAPDGHPPGAVHRPPCPAPPKPPLPRVVASSASRCRSSHSPTAAAISFATDPLTPLPCEPSSLQRRSRSQNPEDNRKPSPDPPTALLPTLKSSMEGE